MDSSRAEEKRKLDEDEEEDEEEDYDDEADKRMRMTPSPAGKKRSAAGASSGRGSASCQAENCSANMSEEKRYHRRHKVCEYHAKATIVVVAGIQQRFCQQCSRFHELGEFDQAKRSCRRQLAGHNERRRKSSCEFPGEGST
ncbi:hypothetical protein MLD38_021157 [Melastoma candidum]|uniref:Uncharacterized protein n=1 Tax=Melastoma candidum TaxID=119954 RepID=A0ACB9QH14_9MYRT|nr:hypothetical protein MLD38_021157 [Melastoma candidum]